MNGRDKGTSFCIQAGSGKRRHMIETGPISHFNLLAPCRKTEMSIAAKLSLLAGLAAVAMIGPASAANKYTCMTDDGYGRQRPCSAGYKAANPNWRAGDSCFTDEGNGRFRPCSAGYKAKHKK